MSDEFVGRKTEIKEVGFEDIVEQLKYACCCCYFCCKCLLKCRYKNYIPVFWTLLWILNGSIWIIYTSAILTNILPSIYMSITLIFVTTFSILSLINAVIVLSKHPGPIDIKWKNWNGEINTMPLIPNHCQTNIDSNMESVRMNDIENKMEVNNENKYCEICNHYKPPRTHHCSQCNICIDRMDHHCVFLNKCIGYNTHRYFIQFLNYYFAFTVFIIPYLFILFIIMSYKIIIKISLFMDVKWILTYLWTIILVFGGLFVLFMVINLLRRQYFLLANDITFIEYIYDKKQTHGQYSKGTKYKNLKFYLCTPTVFHYLLPIIRTHQ